jgi:hypothetical protein
MGKVYDRVYVNTATTGTGAVTPGAAVSSLWQTFAAGGAVASDPVDILILDTGNAWEISTGTYNGTTITRTLVKSSTGSLLNLSGSATIASVPIMANFIYNGGANTLAIANGGTGQTTGPQGYNALRGGASTATAGATTTLTNASALSQVFTGTLTQTVALPDVTTIPIGTTYRIINQSTGALGITTSSAVSITSIATGRTYDMTSIQTSGNTAASWAYTEVPWSSTPLSPSAGGTGLANPAAGSLLKTNGSSPMTLAARGTDFSLLTAGSVVSMSAAASYGFTSLPAGIKRFTLSLNGVTVSTSSSTVGFQLGQGGSYTTSGYTSGYGVINSTSPQAVSSASNTTFLVTPSGTAALIINGIVEFINITGNTWVCRWVLNLNNTGYVSMGSGFIALAGALTQVNIISSSPNFTAGSMNIHYEF